MEKLIMSYFVGIDIGASFIKGALLDLKNLKITSITKYPSPTSLIPKKSEFLRFEVDPKFYVDPVEKLIKGFLKKEKNIKGIVFSTQMHGMIMADSKLKAVTPFIGWQDEEHDQQQEMRGVELEQGMGKFDRFNVTQDVRFLE